MDLERGEGEVGILVDLNFLRVSTKSRKEEVDLFLWRGWGEVVDLILLVDLVLGGLVLLRGWETDCRWEDVECF